jgi:RND family efflux transporter MFP subunit
MLKAGLAIETDQIKSSSHDHGMSGRSARAYGSAALGFHWARIVAIEGERGTCSQSFGQRGTAMKGPLRLRLIGSPHFGHIAAASFALIALSGCDQNTFQPPPPPKVDVALPVQRPITRYLDATGNTAPIKSVDLVARVQGFLESINYQDGAFVKEGTVLFTIEPETYKLKLEQAQAAEAGAQASLKQAEADYKRQSDLVARQAVSQATLDTSTSTRDNAQANLQQAQANTRIAEVNYGYTKVTAPFDGVVTAHLVSVGELVGVASPTQLATIVALDPIYVNFTVNEQDVLRIRAEAARRGITTAELRQFPVDIGLQTEDGYPHAGKLDYVSPTINQSTGTLAVRGLVPNPDRVLLPGYFVRAASPTISRATRCSFPTPRSAATRAGATCWSRTATTSSSSARCLPGRWIAACA